MTGAISIQKVEQDDLPALLLFSKKTFFDAFYHQNKPSDMHAYAAKFFTMDCVEEEFNNQLSQFYFALCNKEILGYIKLNFGNAQTDLQDANSMEVERIYVSTFYQSKQIGKQLIDFAIQIAIDQQLQYIWLGVWEHNTKAIKFYQQNGFELFGKHDFMLGNDLQVDVLMRLSF